jgi:hypothetical protein
MPLTAPTTAACCDHIGQATIESQIRGCSFCRLNQQISGVLFVGFAPLSIACLACVRGFLAAL